MATTYQSIHTGQFIDEQISAVSEKLPLTGGVVTGTIQATKFIGNLEGAATKLLTARTINLTGGISGSGSFNGANDLDIEVTVQNNSHEHAWANITDGDSCTINTSGTVTASKVFGAVWNDYAEFRAQIENIEPGYCVTSNREGQVYKTTERMQYCEGVVSDTFGFAIGETDNCKTPLAIAGRVLVYYNDDINSYNIGDVVCAGPNGKVCKMTREEIKEYPDRIVGTVSEIPSYEIWGTNNTIVNNRIWIKVK